MYVSMIHDFLLGFFLHCGPVFPKKSFFIFCQVLFPSLAAIEKCQDRLVDITWFSAIDPCWYEWIPLNLVVWCFAGRHLHLCGTWRSFYFPGPVDEGPTFPTKYMLPITSERSSYGSQLTDRTSWVLSSTRASTHNKKAASWTPLLERPIVMMKRSSDYGPAILIKMFERKWESNQSEVGTIIVRWAAGSWVLINLRYQGSPHHPNVHPRDLPQEGGLSLCRSQKIEIANFGALILAVVSCCLKLVAENISSGSFHSKVRGFV